MWGDEGIREKQLASSSQACLFIGSQKTVTIEMKMRHNRVVDEKLSLIGFIMLINIAVVNFDMIMKMKLPRQHSLLVFMLILSEE